MALVYLIRHGQASFGSEDYDCLSELGHRQAGLLGAHMKYNRAACDVLISGNLLRQRSTAEGMRDAIGPAAPALVVNEAFDEYDHAGLIRAYLPRFMAEVGTPRGLGEQELFADHKLFELAFRFMIKCWMDNGAHDCKPLETWREFGNRVSMGLSGVLSDYGPKARVWIVTSGGTIAAALRVVLGLSNRRTLSLNWSIYNASVSQLYYGRSRKHEDALLMGFNNVSHLEQSGGRELVTFR